MATGSPLTVGTVLKRQRKAADLAQEALTVRAGYSVVYIGMLERGERLPTALTLDTLAGALALSMEDRAALEAALLGGAAEALRDALRTPLHPIDGEAHHALRATVRAAGRSGEDAWGAGRAMPLGRAIDEALERQPL